MDTLFWTALTPNIKFTNTSKLMYRKYLYRLCLEAPGSAVLRDSEVDIDMEVIKRNAWTKNYNRGGSWKSNRTIKEDDVPLLHVIRQAKDALGDRVKMRIEDPDLQFYAADEATLKELAIKLSYNNNYHFFNVMGPDRTMLSELQQGMILRKNPPKFQYRILLRDGRYSDQTKNSLWNLLNNLDKGDYRVPKSLMENLSEMKSRYIWGGYIHVHDARIATMVAMIDPQLVSRVEEYFFQDNGDL